MSYIWGIKLKTFFSTILVWSVVQRNNLCDNCLLPLVQVCKKLVTFDFQSTLTKIVKYTLTSKMKNKIYVNMEQQNIIFLTTHLYYWKNILCQSIPKSTLAILGDLRARTIALEEKARSEPWKHNIALNQQIVTLCHMSWHKPKWVRHTG